MATCRRAARGPIRQKSRHREIHTWGRIFRASIMSGKQPFSDIVKETLPRFEGDQEVTNTGSNLNDAARRALTPAGFFRGAAVLFRRGRFVRMKERCLRRRRPS